MKVVLASNNEHKLIEIQSILEKFHIEVISQKTLNINIDPEETGCTFEANSEIKAKAVLNACGLPTIADDSGLMVDALNGEPGVYSARYGGDINTSDEDRVNYLLQKLTNVPFEKRTAKFVCVITFITPDGLKIVSRGECPGRIAFKQSGNNGFGYDPIFIYEPYGKTLAEINDSEKNSISHRFRALEDLSAKLQEVYNDHK